MKKESIATAVFERDQAIEKEQQRKAGIIAFGVERANHFFDSLLADTKIPPPVVIETQLLNFDDVRILYEDHNEDRFVIIPSDLGDHVSLCVSNDDESGEPFYNRQQLGNLFLKYPNHPTTLEDL